MKRKSTVSQDITPKEPRYNFPVDKAKEKLVERIERLKRLRNENGSY